MQLFNAHGRLIPGDGERVYHVNDRGYFSLNQPEINYADIHSNCARFLGGHGSGDGVTVGEFTGRCEVLRERMEADDRLGGVFRGVHIPFLLPPPADGSADMGGELDRRLLPAVGCSFTAKFPQFTFTNYLEGRLEGRVTVVHGTRHERVLASRVTGWSMGWYFPNCLAGYAIPDQRRLICRLPEPFLLSGPLEAACAFIGVPEILMKNGNYPNLLALAAVRPPEDHLFHFFEAYGWNLTFNQRSMVGAVSEYYAGGLTLLA